MVTHDAKHFTSFHSLNSLIIQILQLSPFSRGGNGSLERLICPNMAPNASQIQIPKFSSSHSLSLEKPEQLLHIHSFKNYLPNAFEAPGTVIGAGNTVVMLQKKIKFTISEIVGSTIKKIITD